MRCPVCENPTKVFDSRLKEDFLVWRRRECKECLTRFTTFEKIKFSSLPDYVLSKLGDEQ